MSKAQKPKVTVGILSFHDEKYLEHGIPTLLKQDYPNFEIFVCDNNEDPKKKIRKWIEKNYPTVKVVEAGGNIGFGPGHNYIIDQAIKNGSKYYFGYNSDMYASSNVLSKLVETLEAKPKCACVTPKLFQWRNFPAKPDPTSEQFIDSTGLIAKKSHHFWERGSGEKDRGQYNKPEEVWGSSGAAPLFRIAALKDVAHQPGEYFDQNFFMYKEDADMMYRLHWAGWKIFFQPEATIWHDRTAVGLKGLIANIKGRLNRSKYIQENSFLNQLQLLEKNFSPEFSWQTKIKTKLFMLKYFLYLIIFDRHSLKRYQDFKKLKPEIRAKREKMTKRVSPKEIENQLI